MNPEHEQMLETLGHVDEKVDGVASEVGEVRRGLEYHIGEGHAALITGEEVERMVGKFDQSMHALVEQQELLAEVVLGKRQVTFDGEVERAGGIQQIVSEYQQNKGFSIDVPWAKITAVLIAAISAGAAVIIALIETVLK